MIVSFIWSSRQSKKADEDLALAVEIMDNIFERTILRDEYLIHREDRARLQWQAKSEDLAALLRAASAMCSKGEDKATLDEMVESYQATLAIFRKLIENDERTQAGGISRTLAAEYEKRLFSQILLKSYALSDSAGRLQESRTAAATSARRQLTVLLAVCIFLVGATVLINGSVIRRKLGDRIAQLRHGTEIIGRGNLDYRIDVQANDEISDLARQTNEMAAKLKHSHTSVEQLQTEVTERKRSEEALAASEVRYRRLFEAARDGILILDAETGMVLDVNPFLIQMLGFPHETLLGKKVWELGCFKDIVSNQANFAELQQKEYIRYEDKPLGTADKRQIEVEFVSNVYRVNHHKVIQCNIRDITARKLAETERDQLIQDLQKALANVKSLSGLLPICAGCKKIRDDKGYWSQVESYVQEHSEATFTHGLCPDCIKKYFPGLEEDGPANPTQETP
jgi:PAS domain S-box-containing protein